MGAFIEAPFGGETRKFRIDIGGLRELQEKCDAGPATILTRLASFQPQVAGKDRPNPDDYVDGIESAQYSSDLTTYSLLRSIGGDWRVNDVREPIRLGLIGAGMTPTDAMILVSRYIDQLHKYPLADNVPLAAEIVMHAIMSEPDDPAGKATAENPNQTATD